MGQISACPTFLCKRRAGCAFPRYAEGTSPSRRLAIGTPGTPPTRIPADNTAEPRASLDSHQCCEGTWLLDTRSRTSLQSLTSGETKCLA